MATNQLSYLESLPAELIIPILTEVSQFKATLPLRANIWSSIPILFVVCKAYLSPLVPAEILPVLTNTSLSFLMKSPCVQDRYLILCIFLRLQIVRHSR